MKNKFFARVACFFIAFFLTFGTSPVLAENVTNIVGDGAYDAPSLIDDILSFKMQDTGSDSIQQWIDGEITKKAGLSSEWYVLALSQSGQYDFSSYREALESYLKENKVASASSREKYAFILLAIGSDATYIDTVMEDSIGEQGVMSFVYGLHLLNNGAVSSVHTIESVKEQLLSMQLADGGWAVMGTTGDNDVTAMVIQSLAPYYENDLTVQSAIDKALALLASRQLEDGDYANYGIPNLESTAQVVIALSSLGIDAKTDSRFIKNGNTLFDGLEKYKLQDGSFCHTEGGSFNDTATVQALQAFVSYARMTEGETGLYILDSSDVYEETEDESGKASLEQTATQGEIEDDSQNQETLESTIADDFNKENIQNEKANVSYKVYACILLFVLACFLSLLFFVLKKRNKNNFLFIWIVAILAICFVLFTDFQSADDYYNSENGAKEDVIGTVTLMIRCDTVLDKLEDKSEDMYSYIPVDGVVLEETTFFIEEGETVYDILLEATQKYKMQMEHSGSNGMIYISGINYLYEFDFGEFSGWMYFVNDVDASVGCDQYVLSDGDKIEWLYTCELGQDLKKENGF